MKKLVIIVGIVFMLIGCHMFNGHTTVVNDSNYTVSFTWGGKVEILEPKERASIGFTYVQISKLQPNKRVKVNYIDENNRNIINLQSYEVRVENITSELLTLKADGWLENDMVNIPVGEFTGISSQKGIIYTKTPVFNITGNNFPVTITYQFVNNICYVKLF
jgi:hypothetical protein